MYRILSNFIVNYTQCKCPFILDVRYSGLQIRSGRFVCTFQPQTCTVSRLPEIANNTTEVLGTKLRWLAEVLHSIAEPCSRVHIKIRAQLRQSLMYRYTKCRRVAPEGRQFQHCRAARIGFSCALSRLQTKF